MEKRTAEVDNQGFWNQNASSYDRKTRALCKSYQMVIDRISREIDKGQKVLEVATGTGIIALKLAERAGFVEAIDFAPVMIEVAREKAFRLGVANITFSVANAYHLEFPDLIFDAVVMSNALHVMQRPETALAEARRVLKKDGVLVAPTYCHGQNLRSRLLSRVMALTGFKAYHRFTLETYLALIATNGFTIDKSVLLPDLIPVAYVVARKSN